MKNLKNIKKVDYNVSNLGPEVALWPEEIPYVQRKNDWRQAKFFSFSRKSAHGDAPVKKIVAYFQESMDQDKRFRLLLPLSRRARLLTD
jgi:hypothetical protein